MVLPSHGTVFLLRWTVSYKPSGSKPFTVSEHAHIRYDGLRVSAADWGFSSIEPSLSVSAYDQPHVFLPLLTSFRNTFTLTVSGYVVV